jgi:hypothetical protein
MRAIYRLSPSEAMALPAAEFFALAYRLPFYNGVLRARAALLVSPDDVQPTHTGAVRHVPATRAAILSDPDLSGVVSFGTSSGDSHA